MMVSTFYCVFLQVRHSKIPFDGTHFVIFCKLSIRKYFFLIIIIIIIKSLFIKR